MIESPSGVLRYLKQKQPSPTHSLIDWNEVVRRACEEQVLPAFNEQLFCTEESFKGLPGEIRRLFTTVEGLNSERNQTILSEAIHAATLLNQIGIQPIALKGLAYLLTNTYRSVGSRYLLDIDFLIPAGQLREAANHLNKSGYYDGETSKFLQKRHHLPALRRDGSPCLELHQQVILGSNNRILPASRIAINSRPLNVKGTTFLIPSPTDLVNHLILHSQLAHPYHDRIFPPLRALIDLAQLQARYPTEIDWHSLAATYKKHGQLPTLILHLHQAKEILGLPIPEPIPQHLGFFLRLRYQRRALLNRHPTLRFLDPTYLYMSLLSRRLRLLPILLQTPSAWPQLLRLLTRPTFYRNLIR